MSTGGIRRESRQHLDQRFGAAGRRADGDQVAPTRAHRARRLTAGGGSITTFERSDDRRPIDARPGPRRHLELADELVAHLDGAAYHVDARLLRVVDRTELERAQRGFAASRRQRGDHHDWQRMRLHQLLEELEAAHARHFDVQSEHVWLEVLKLAPGGVAIERGADDLDLRVAAQDVAQRAAHQRRIVDHQHLDAPNRRAQDYPLP